MKIVNFGSLNLDHVYQVAHTVVTGETLAADAVSVSLGGKGLNQSIAIARAGAQVTHAGMVGPEGGVLKEYLAENGVDVSLLGACDAPQGNAFIQVNREGENCIIIFGGSNREVSQPYIDRVLNGCSPGDYIITQNEISNVRYLIRAAKARGLKVVLNASPIDEEIRGIDYTLVDWLVINEIEGAAIAGVEAPGDILPALLSRYPQLGVILTLGKAGCVCAAEGKTWRQATFLDVPAVDTTAAGDTFLGYCVAGMVRGDSVETFLLAATAASTIAVSRPGAAASIPASKEVETFLRAR